MDSKYLPIKDVANFLQLSPQTVTRFIKSGQLGAIKLGKLYRVGQETMENFLAKRLEKKKNANLVVDTSFIVSSHYCLDCKEYVPPLKVWVFQGRQPLCVACVNKIKLDVIGRERTSL